MESTVKLKITTAMIIGGIIFLASLFSGWLTQSKDIGNVLAEQKRVREESVAIDKRLVITEQSILSMKEDLKEVKDFTKEIRKDQIDFYKKIERKLK